MLIDYDVIIFTALDAPNRRCWQRSQRQQALKGKLTCTIPKERIPKTVESRIKYLLYPPKMHYKTKNKYDLKIYFRRDNK
jgi:hypothetical protein